MTLDFESIFCTALEFAILAQLRHPLPVDVDEPVEELRIPATELTYNRCLLYIVTSLGKGLI